MEYTVDEKNKVVVFTDSPDNTIGAFGIRLEQLKKEYVDFHMWTIRFKEPIQVNPFDFKMPELNQMVSIYGSNGIEGNNKKS